MANPEGFAEARKRQTFPRPPEGCAHDDAFVLVLPQGGIWCEQCGEHISKPNEKQSKAWDDGIAWYMAGAR